LILDPDTELYPRCLDVLAATLDGIPDAVLAYPMLQVSGMVDWFIAEGGDYLLSVFGWEPRRLRRWARIDGLAMIRTAELRQLGGFTTDPRLSGWEDYDLWCRIADRGWRGQLVPQILGRYRASAVSAPGVRNPVSPAAIAALMERAPRLLAGVLPAEVTSGDSQPG
jgi:hypothetical protein